MAATELLRLLVDADVRGAVTGLERVGATAEREGRRADSSLDRWGNRLQTTGTAMVAFGSAALFGLGHLAQASEEANFATLQLENTISNMPKLAGENSQQFIDLAESIQDVTAADADAIVAAEAMLGTFSLTADEIKDITPLVVDYARKFGVDMVDAATQVGKALDGQVGALRRNGVTIDETLFATDRYRAVQEALANQVGGFAEQEGATFAGSLERLKNQLGDLAEGVGAGAVDAFSDLFSVAQSVTDKLNEMSPATQETIGRILTYGSVVIIAAGATSTLIGQVIKMRENFGTAKDTVASFATSIPSIARAAGPLAAVAVAVGAIGFAFEKVVPNFEADLDKLTNDLLDFADSGRVAGELARLAGDDLGTLAEAFEEIVDTSGFEEAANASSALIDALTGGSVDTDLQEAKNRIDDLDKSLAQLAERDPEAAAAVFEELSAALQEQGLSAEDVRSQLDDYASAIEGLETTERLAGDSTDNLGRSMDEQAADTEEARTALEEYSDELRSMFDPLFGAQDALAGNQEAMQRVTEAELGLIAAQNDYNDAVSAHGETSAEALEAFGALTEAQIGLEEAHRNAAGSAMDLDVAMEELRLAVENGDVSLGEAQRTMQGWVSQGLLSQASADAQIRKFEQLTGTVLGIPGGRTITITTQGFRETMDSAFGVVAAVSSIPRSVDIEVNFHSRGGGIAGQVLTFRQHGGPASRHQPLVVGEAGPELFIPNQDGEIISNTTLKGMRGGGSAFGLGGGSVSSGGEQTLRIILEGTGLFEGFRREIATKHGGDVQAALGQR